MKENFKKMRGLLLAFLIIAPPVLLAQDLDQLLDAMPVETVDYTLATFKSSRVINLHSPERVAPGALEFRISHRFGPLNGGAYQLWGLDQSTIRIALEYGLTDKLMVGVGRSTYQKSFDGFVKYALLRQSTGAKVMPVSVVWVGSTTLNSLRWEYPDRTNYFSSRLAFVNQIVIARKFGENFSAEIVPTWVHYNLVNSQTDVNDIPAMGFGARYKVTRRMSINSEYTYRVKYVSNADNLNNYYDSFSLGVDIETGGHVFQFQVTNSLPMIDKGFIAETTDRWQKGGIHLGFNITREFSLSKKNR
jgi:hypothetical protein